MQYYSHDPGVQLLLCFGAPNPNPKPLAAMWASSLVGRRETTRNKSSNAYTILIPEPNLGLKIRLLGPLEAGFPLHVKVKPSRRP